MANLNFTKKLDENGNTVVLLKGKNLPDDFLGLGFDLKIAGMEGGANVEVVLAKGLEELGSAKPIVINRNLTKEDGKLVVGLTMKANQLEEIEDGVLLFLRFDKEVKGQITVLNTVFSKYDKQRIDLKDVKWVVDKSVGKLTKAEKEYLLEASLRGDKIVSSAAKTSKSSAGVGGNFDEFVGLEQVSSGLNIAGLNVGFEIFGLLIMLVVGVVAFFVSRNKEKAEKLNQKKKIDEMVLDS